MKEKSVSLSAKKTDMLRETTNVKKRNAAIMVLKERIEMECKRVMKTPKDYDLLAVLVYQKTHCNVSVSTLKRFMGYLHSSTRTSASTLDILSQYVGYLDFEDFLHSYDCNEKIIKNLNKQELARCLQHLRLQATSLCEQITRIEEMVNE